MIPDLDDWSVNEVVAEFPDTVALFKRYGIDACCGGALPVRLAAQRYDADVAALLADLHITIQLATEKTCAGQAAHDGALQRR